VLNPMQERRRKYEVNPKLAWEVIEAGGAKARKICEQTMNDVRGSMNMTRSFEAPSKTAGVE